MRKALAIAALGIALTGGSVAHAQGNSPQAPGHNRQPVCHLQAPELLPDGSVAPAQYKLLLVPPPGLVAHLRHGDVLPVNGACPAVPVPAA